MKRHRDVVWLVLLLLLAAGFGLARAMQQRPSPPRLHHSNAFGFAITKGGFGYTYALQRHVGKAATCLVNLYQPGVKPLMTTGTVDDGALVELMDRLEAAGALQLPTMNSSEVGYTDYSLDLDGQHVEFGGRLDPAHQRVLDVLTDSVVYKTMLTLRL